MNVFLSITDEGCTSPLRNSHTRTFKHVRAIVQNLLALSPPLVTKVSFISLLHDFAQRNGHNITLKAAHFGPARALTWTTVEKHSNSMLCGATLYHSPHPPSPASSHSTIFAFITPFSSQTWEETNISMSPNSDVVDRSIPFRLGRKNTQSFMKVWCRVF